MFNDECFEDESRIFSVKEIRQDGILLSRTRTLRKAEFAELITTEQKKEEVFQNFRLVQDFIEQELSK
jgi:hypothetical protein